MDGGEIMPESPPTVQTTPMDLPTVLSILYPGVNCGPMSGSLNTYAEFSAHWPAENRACPTLQTLEETWSEYLANPTEYGSVPQSVSRWRFLQALRETPYSGGVSLYDAVNAAIAGSGSSALANRWAEVTEIVRDSGTVEQLRLALGLTKPQVDAVFRLAGSYPS
jgi:hypothetical protein